MHNTESTAVVNFTVEERRYPKSLDDFLSSPTPAGSGLHQWIASAVGKLSYWIQPGEIYDLLLPIVIEAGRPEGQARRDVREAVRNLGGNSTVVTAAPGPKWPDPNLDRINRTVREQIVKIRGSAIDHLRSISPAKNRTAPQIINQLWPGDPLLCVGVSNQEFITKRKSRFISFENKALIVPNAMSAVMGTVQNTERQSYHTKENCGPREHLVLEFDWTARDNNGKPTAFAPLIEEWDEMGLRTKAAMAGMILHIQHRRRLVLVVDSGGKSLHAWLDVRGESEASVHEFMQYAVTLGACRSTYNKNQFVRMPEGTRDNGKRQEAIYFNTNTL